MWNRLSKKNKFDLVIQDVHLNALNVTYKCDIDGWRNEYPLNLDIENGRWFIESVTDKPIKYYH